MSEAKYSCAEDVLCGINVPKNPSALTDLEKKHLPTIKSPDQIKQNEAFEIKVLIGGIDGVQHPNEPAHFIEWIGLYNGDTFLAECRYIGGISYPEAIFKVALSHNHGPLKVLTRCNLHGIWCATKDIKIKA